MTYSSVISTDRTKGVCPFPSELDPLRMPDHIAVIMDEMEGGQNQGDCQDQLDIQLELSL